MGSCGQDRTPLAAALRRYGAEGKVRKPSLNVWKLEGLRKHSQTVFTEGGIADDYRKPSPSKALQVVLRIVVASDFTIAIAIMCRKFKPRLHHSEPCLYAGRGTNFDSADDIVWWSEYSAIHLLI